MRDAHLLAACGTVLSCLVLAGQTRDPRVDTYLEAVQRYRRGDIVGASGMLTGWTPRDIQRVGVVVLAGRDGTFIERAAMLHTEIVSLEILSHRQTAASHLRVAESLVRALPPDHAPFQQRWYALAASIFRAITDPEGGRLIVARGLRLFPRDPELHVAAGAIDEMLAHSDNPDCVGPACDSRDANSRAWGRLRTAGGEYREALALDSANGEARLRLGRVLFMQNQRKEARVELAAVTRGSTPVRLQYLVHLFVGAIDAFEGDLGAARHEYEAAILLEPQFHTAYIALSSVEQLTGLEAQSRQTIARLSALGPDATNPWLEYQSGSLDREALAWLRAQVQR